MHSNFLTTIILALCVARGVMSAPLDTFSAEDPTTPKETENMERIASATKLAHNNVLKMEHVLNDPSKPENAEMIHAAFGTTTPEDLEKIKGTVSQLKTGVVPVKLPSAGSGILAYTDYNNQMQPTHVEFGDTFHNTKKTSENARAATVVHEATHYLSNTGDYIKNGEVLPGNDRQTSPQTGYASGPEPKTSAADLNQDPLWTKMRDGYTMKDISGTVVPGTKKLFQNAESFGQFSTMCGAAVSDHEVGLRRRALEERDWDTAAFYLVKRQMCSINSRPKAKTAPTTDSKLSSSAKTKVSAVSKLLGAKKAAEAKKSGAATKDRSVSKGATLSPKAKSKISAVSKLNSAAKKANAKKLSTTATKARVSKSKSTKPSLRTKSSLSKSKSAKSSLLKGSKKALPALSKGKSKGRVASAKFGAARSKTGKTSKTAKTGKSAAATRVKSKGAASKKLKSFPVGKKKSALSSKRPTSKKNLAKSLGKSATRKTAKGAAKRPASSKKVAKTQTNKGVSSKKSSLGGKVAKTQANKRISKKTSPGNKAKVAKSQTNKNVASKKKTSLSNKAKVAKTQTNKRVAPKVKTNSGNAKATKKQANVARPAGNRGGSTPAVKKTSQAASKKAQTPPPPVVKAKVTAKKGRS